MRNYIFILIVISLLVFKTSYSQDAINDTIQLSEIKVTAEKKEARIQDLPLSVSSISAKTVQNEKAVTVRDLSGWAPNVYMPSYGSKLTAPVYIRGVGSRVNSPSVGLYVDGVPYFEKSMFAFNLEDVERIEILRGPQGTLYGRNTLGGIISIITKEPTNYRYLNALIDLGNYGQQKYKLTYSQPIVKSLSFMIDGSYEQLTGFWTNAYTQTQVGSDYTKQGRFKLKYAPSEKLKIVYQLNGEDSHENGYPYATTDSTSVIAPVNYNHVSTYDRTTLGQSLKINYQNDVIQFSSVTAMEYLSDTQNVDQDFLPKDYFIVGQDVKQNQYTQEFIVTNKNNGKIDAILGAFGFYQTSNQHIDLRYGNDGADYHLTPGNGYDKYNDFTNLGLAIFGQVSYKELFQIIDITLGLRYDNEWNDLDYLYNTLSQNVTTTKKDTTFKTSFNELMPKVALRFKITPNQSAYFSLSRGYRGGGFNTSFVDEADQTYNSESSWNYEVGYKSDLLDHKLTANLSLFYIYWLNQQVSQRVTTGGNMYKNAGKTESKGFEAEIAYRPFQNFIINGNVGFTQAKYLDFQPNVAEEDNYKGNYLPFVPGYTYVVSASYRQPLQTKILNAVRLNISANGIGKQYWDDENEYFEDPYTLVNARISAELPWGEVSLWGKNILNQEYSPYRFYISTFKTWYAQAGNPATFGISLSYKLNQKL